MMYTIGIPKEIKANERRVSLTPNIVQELTSNMITVYVEKTAGHDAGFTDEDYLKCGAIICHTAKELYANSNVIVKVKEPLDAEYELINEKHIIFSFFHFASSTTLLKAMIESKASCVAYETIEASKDLPHQIFPILAPMSVIAGEQSMINANKYTIFDETVEVTVIGAGNVGRAAAYKAKELGYKFINLIDKNFEKIKPMESQGFKLYDMTDENLLNLLKKSKIIIGSIYNAGEKATKILSNDVLDILQDGTIIMDVAIDQGGMTDQSRPTTITDPLIAYKNVKIYCVPNIPSCVPNEASCKLSEAVFPYLLHFLQSNDLEDAISKSEQFKSGLNVHKGQIYHKSLLNMLQ